MQVKFFRCTAKDCPSKEREEEELNNWLLIINFRKVELSAANVITTKGPEPTAIIMVEYEDNKPIPNQENKDTVQMKIFASDEGDDEADSKLNDFLDLLKLGEYL